MLTFFFHFETVSDFLENLAHFFIIIIRIHSCRELSRTPTNFSLTPFNLKSLRGIQKKKSKDFFQNKFNKYQTILQNVIQGCLLTEIMYVIPFLKTSKYINCIVICPLDQSTNFTNLPGYAYFFLKRLFLFRENFKQRL